MSSRRQRIVVVGHGMVGHHFVSTLVDLTDSFEITVIGEEAALAYDRVHLSTMFDGNADSSLCLVDERHATHPAITYRSAERVVSIDRVGKSVQTETQRAEHHTYTYDVLVLATGSTPFVPPISGIDGNGCFVYRTIDDVAAITAYAAGCRVGTVIGGGLLGLEAANALKLLGLHTKIIEAAPRLMAAQLDDSSARLLRRKVDAMGFETHVGFPTLGVERHPNGSVAAIVGGPVDSQVHIPTDMIVVAAGIRPRDDLGRRCGLEVGARGGIAINSRCRTSDENIFAVGECVSFDGQLFGLVAPGYDMAATVAENIASTLTPVPQAVRLDRMFTPKNPATTLKLLGVDVASIGNPHADGDVVMVSDVSVVKRLVFVDRQLVGATLVGDVASFSVLNTVAQGLLPVPEDPLTLIGVGGAVTATMAFPDAAIVCSCHNVSAATLRDAIASTLDDDPSVSLNALKSATVGCTKAGTGCGSCVQSVTTLAGEGMKAKGLAVSSALCEHFPQSRRELFDIIRVTANTSFGELLRNFGRGTLGCEVCRPTVASMLASTTNTYILDGEQAALQDTNDHFLANIQRNGTYSVIPRVPGGEIRPDQLIALGTVAQKFGLYAKITGGQRVDLLGAHVEQLPQIWRDLIDAGFESGHAYGKALRTVKSCVGDTWCRYGVQDSVSMAIRLELRYRGLRAPHKIKLAVSGCARECAEAQGKDVGIIATESGWNLYVGGNGGMRPVHAQLLAQDLSDDELVTAIDRYLMFYIRTADRLERTATWQAKLDGGVEYLKGVIFDDRLAIAGSLDTAIAKHVDSYQCEWTATLSEPKRLDRFVNFVNRPGTVDPDIEIVTERQQPIPTRVPVAIGRRN